MAPLRASLARSPPRLGRSQAGGLHPQTPRAAPPGAPSRTGPLLPRSPSRRGFRARVRRWRFSGFWEISKSWAARSAAGGSGGVPPVVGRRWATRPRRWAARVQPLAAVPAVHGLGEVVHGRPGYRAHLFGRALEKTGVFLGEPRKAVFPGVRKRKRTSCI